MNPLQIAENLSAADVARERAADPSIAASAHARLTELAEQADEAMEGAWFATNHVETSGCEAEFISWCSPMTILRLLREHELFRQALLAHPSRGVVDEVALAEAIQDHTGCGDSDSIYAAHAVIQHLKAAQPAVPSDEWKDRLATALDDLGNPTGLIYFANGRVIGSRQFYIHVVHGDALPVRFADPAHQSAVPSVPEGMAEFDSIAVGVRQSLADGDGFWHPCSGCYETEDGQAVGHYPYSATFQCTLGGGCSECGGLGAVWDNNDYNAMLAATPAHDQPEGVI